MGEETDVTSEDEVRCGGREAEGGVLLADLEMEVRQDLKWHGFRRSIRDAEAKCRKKTLHTVEIARTLRHRDLGLRTILNALSCRDAVRMVEMRIIGGWCGYWFSGLSSDTC